MAMGQEFRAVSDELLLLIFELVSLHIPKIMSTVDVSGD